MEGVEVAVEPVVAHLLGVDGLCEEPFGVLLPLDVQCGELFDACRQLLVGLLQGVGAGLCSCRPSYSVVVAFAWHGLDAEERVADHWAISSAASWMYCTNTSLHSACSDLFSR